MSTKLVLAFFLAYNARAAVNPWPQDNPNGVPARVGAVG